MVAVLDLVALVVVVPVVVVYKHFPMLLKIFGNHLDSMVHHRYRLVTHKVVGDVPMEIQKRG